MIEEAIGFDRKSNIRKLQTDKIIMNVLVDAVKVEGNRGIWNVLVCFMGTLKYELSLEGFRHKRFDVIQEGVELEKLLGEKEVNCVVN